MPVFYTDNPSNVTGTVHFDNTNLSVTSSVANPVVVTGTVALGGASTVNATSSIANPVVVTGTVALGGASTVTANIGTTNGLALDATLTGGTVKVQVANGANTLAVDVSGRPTVNVNGTVPISSANLDVAMSLLARDSTVSKDATLTGGSAKTQVVNGANTLAVDGTGKVGINNFPAAQGTKELRAGTSAVTAVTPGVASSTVLASNVNRVGGAIFNSSAATIAYIALNAVSTLLLFTIKLAPGGYYEIPSNYTGAISGITASSTAAVIVTEFTP